MSRRGELPELPHDFNHAIFESVVLGPRCELTLKLNPLVWIGHRGYYRPAVAVRFGSIVNFGEVEALFARNYQEQSELGWLRYDAEQPSKPGDLYLRLEFERLEAHNVIHCHSLTVTEPEPDAA